MMNITGLSLDHQKAIHSADTASHIARAKGTHMLALLLHFLSHHKTLRMSHHVQEKGSLARNFVHLKLTATAGKERRVILRLPEVEVCLSSSPQPQSSRLRGITDHDTNAEVNSPLSNIKHS